MWLKNLVFIALCLAGLSTLAASLAPVHKQPRDGRSRSDDRSVAGKNTAAGQAAAPDQADIAEVAAQMDRLFRADWTAAGLTPAPVAEDLVVARRLSLALTGTIPSLEEIRHFENEPAEGRLDRRLEDLLEDRRCQDYLAERLTRAFVGVQDGPFIIFRRRRFVAWLTDQLQANRPYNEIVRDLITDSGIWTDRPATNFITVTIKPDQEKGPDEGELAARVSRAFLGVRLDCAECHDHPFQPWKQRDFQGLAAFFGQTKQQGLKGIVDAEGEYEVENRVTGGRDKVAPCVPFQSDLLPADGTRREKLAAWVTHRSNRAFARAAANRFWAELFGRPLVEPIDDIPSVGDPPPVLDLLADDFVEHGYDLRRLIRVIAATAVFRLDSGSDPSGPEITPAHEAAWAAFPLIRLRPEQVVGGLLQSTSLPTIDYQSHIVVRVIRAGTQNDFIKRYGDLGEEEFSPQGGTIPQRLLMMNGKQLQERIGENVLANAATHIAMLAPSDEKAVETAYLATLTRRPTADEAKHFVAALGDQSDKRSRNQRMEDLYWCLLNSTEFSWNH
ncbi:MAG TPA: DUF1549 domain-containing protein [Pirellulales bacterium]|nr:DUF1549 domain-containing protein [Pirellulales bacterium]